MILCNARCGQKMRKCIGIFPQDDGSLILHEPRDAQGLIEFMELYPKTVANSRFPQFIISKNDRKFRGCYLNMTAFPLFLSLVTFKNIQVYRDVAWIRILIGTFPCNGHNFSVPRSSTVHSKVQTSTSLFFFPLWVMRGKQRTARKHKRGILPRCSGTQEATG